MTLRKSGSIVAMASQVGAAAAMDDPGVLGLVGRFGSHIGVIAQILNDIDRVQPGVDRRGSDLRRRKKTLPIAYALRSAREENLPEILAWSTRDIPATSKEEGRLAAAIDRLGARHYAWVVADAHRREALAALRTLARLTGRDDISALRRLIPDLRPRHASQGLR